MTVEELIEVLKTFPKFYTVHIICDTNKKDEEEVYDFEPQDLKKN